MKKLLNTQHIIKLLYSTIEIKWELSMMIYCDENDSKNMIMLNEWWKLLIIWIKLILVYFNHILLAHNKLSYNISNCYTLLEIHNDNVLCYFVDGISIIIMEFVALK